MENIIHFIIHLYVRNIVAFKIYDMQTLHKVKEITGTSADTIYKHYAGADVEEIAKKMRS